MDKITFSMTINVENQHLDALDHVNNLQYLKWGESIAQKHWNFLIKDSNMDENLWVILRHEIDYKKEGRLGDKIDIITWVGETSVLRSIRHFEFYRGKEMLAKMETTFCLFSLESRKPIKISEELRNLLLPAN